MTKDYKYYVDLGVFDVFQLQQINWGLSLVDVSIYADPKFDTDQMHEIRMGLKGGVDVSIYADPKFDDYQMEQIRIGLWNGVDVSIFADPKFNWYQMEELRIALKNNEDPTETITEITIENL